MAIIPKMNLIFFHFGSSPFGVMAFFQMFIINKFNIYKFYYKLLLLILLMLPIHIIFNRIANQGKSVDVLNQIINFFDARNIKYTIYETKYIGHAKKLSHTITSNKKPVHVISVGGDGTLHEILNGFQNMNKHFLSIIPAGSGNDFVTILNAPYDKTETILERIIKQKPTYVDYIDINDDQVRCMNLLGFGIDSKILYDYQHIKCFNPKTRYKLATIKNCLHPKTSKCKIWIDDDKSSQDLETIIFAIGNGKYIGGGIKVNEKSSPFDGKLSVSYVPKVKFVKILPSIIKLSKNQIDKIDKYHEFFCTKIKLQLSANIYQCDGEIYQNSSTLDVKVVHNKLQVVI